MERPAGLIWMLEDVTHWEQFSMWKVNQVCKWPCRLVTLIAEEEIKDALQLMGIWKIRKSEVGQEVIAYQFPRFGFGLRKANSQRLQLLTWICLVLLPLL
jgi:hypothetical protein